MTSVISSEDPSRSDARGDARAADDKVPRLVLLGMMGAGKSTVGRLLADELGWPYLDNDVDVRALTDLEPPAMRASLGEDALHRAEAQAFLRAMEHREPLVIGAAAWVIEDPECAMRLDAEPAVVYLRGRPETLLQRIGEGKGRRHDATDAAWLRDKATARDERYRALASLTIDVDTRTPEEITRLIIDRLARP